MSKLLTLSMFSIFAVIDSLSQTASNDTTVRLGINSLFVANINILSKEYDGICDCSIGNKKNKNHCSLFKFKTNRVLYRADSLNPFPTQYSRVAFVIANEKFTNKLIVGQKYLAVLGATSSNEYLQIVDTLNEQDENRYRFSQYAHLTSLINCRGKRGTIKQN